MPRPLAALWLPALLALLAMPGCVDSDAGTAVYVYDAVSASVRVWDAVAKVHSAAQSGTAIAAPDRVIASTLYDAITLAWGGMALDDGRDVLYLVSEAGTVFAVAKARTQDGTLSSTSDITYFSLGESTDRFPSGSVFGQASVDASGNILYVMESSKDGSGCRVWKVASASQQTNGAILTPAATYTTGVADDTYGAGLAALPGGGVFGLFGGGGPVYSSSSTYTGPRLRLGPSGSFKAADALGVSSDVIIGADTRLSDPTTLGALGYDALNACLYVFSGPASGAAAILVYDKIQFTSGGFDQVPARTLGDSASTLADLRIIAHPPTSDWLLGANCTASTSTTGTGQATLFIWKAPSAGGSAIQAALPDSTSGALQIRAMTIGGS